MSAIAPAYFDTRQAASYLSLSTQYLEAARCKGEGPPFIRLARRVRYAKSDLDAWMEQRRQQQLNYQQ